MGKALRNQDFMTHNEREEIKRNRHRLAYEPIAEGKGQRRGQRSRRRRKRRRGPGDIGAHPRRKIPQKHNTTPISTDQPTLAIQTHRNNPVSVTG